MGADNQRHGSGRGRAWERAIATPANQNEAWERKTQSMGAAEGGHGSEPFAMPANQNEAWEQTTRGMGAAEGGHGSERLRRLPTKMKHGSGTPFRPLKI